MPVSAKLDFQNTIKVFRSTLAMVLSSQRFPSLFSAPHRDASFSQARLPKHNQSFQIYACHGAVVTAVSEPV